MGANFSSLIAKRSTSFRSDAKIHHQPPKAATSLIIAFKHDIIQQKGERENERKQTCRYFHRLLRSNNKSRIIFEIKTWVSHFKSNRQKRNFHRRKYLRSKLRTGQERFCFQTWDCLERSKRDRLLVRTVASDGIHRRFRIRFFEQTMHNYSRDACIVVQNR